MSSYGGKQIPKRRFVQNIWLIKLDGTGGFVILPLIDNMMRIRRERVVYKHVDMIFGGLKGAYISPRHNKVRAVATLDSL